MISVMNECKINRRSCDSADLSFFGFDSPQEGSTACVDGQSPSGGDDFNKAKVLELDLEVRVRSPGSEVVRDGSALVEMISSPSSLSHEVSAASWIHGFQLGDMVWGKVKSHPWWPGQIFNEAFASPSVCRMKREGHLLVAFFGDSSYGWFDPDELIPFDAHFPEKSRQTNLRNFVKAVEEAVDEVSRRGALALACRCRSPYNFRPAAVPRCFSVDLVGYEPGAIYSSRQIEKARDSFAPSEVLSFVHQLAVMPQRIEPCKSIESIRGMSMLLAYRRAVFEEFDETYAQAFGAQPIRPTRNDSGVPDQRNKFAPRAVPLSGRLVIAEALGDKRSSSKASTKAAAKTPSSSSSSVSKKNKYALKRRDESPETFPPQPDLRPASQIPGDHQQPQASAVISSPPALREPELPTSAGSINKTTATDVRWSGSPPELPSGRTPAAGSRSVWEDFDDWMMKPQTPPHLDTYEPVGRPEITESAGGSPMKLDSPIDAADPKEIADCSNVLPDLHITGSKFETMAPLDGSVNMEKVRKRPVDGLIEMLKKKKKKIKTVEAGADQPLISRESCEAVSPPNLDSDSLGLKLPALVADLSSLALNPFHGIERDAPDTVRHVFLRFRSIVYQKSLPQAGEADVAEVRASKPAAVRSPLEPGTVAADIASAKDVKEQIKSFKSVSRPDDPTKAGRKRGMSDRQKEISAKSFKKLSQLKALASERKAGIRQKDGPEAPQQRDQTAAVPVKKEEHRPAPRIPSPTSLVMKFPPQTTLPSIATLKVRFGRFGPLDLSGARVHWKTHSCKVLFRFKSDAEAAYNHATNNDLFGQVKVSYTLRELELPAVPEQPSGPEKRPAESHPVHFRPGNGSDVSAGQQRLSPYQQLQRQNSVQLKSILKKPGDDGGGAAAAAARESPRVKFMLGGDDDRREPMADVASPPLLPMEPIINKNPRFHPRSLIHPPPPPPHSLQPPASLPPPTPLPPAHIADLSRGRWLPPLPVHIADVFRGRMVVPLSEVRQRDGEGERRDGKEVDISDQMMGLLLSCSEIVTNLNSSLGYVPYHPL